MNLRRDLLDRNPTRGGGGDPLRPAKTLVFLLILLALSWDWSGVSKLFAAPGEISSVAVLPLGDFRNDSAHDFLVEGMTEAIIVYLSRVRSLEVISGTSMPRRERVDLPVPEIARALGADSVVRGSVLREDSKIRVTVELLEGSAGKQLWTEEYVRDLKDLQKLQDEVARTLLRAVSAVLTADEEELLATAPRADSRAYQLNLRGRFQLRRGGFQEAVSLFRESIEVDPAYAPAHSGLAWALFLMGSWHSSGNPEVVREPAKEAALRALELDPKLGEAHVALAHIRNIFEWDWAGAERAYRQGLELNPGWRTDADCLYSGYLVSMGRFEEAVAFGRTTLELDPYSAWAAIQLGSALEYAGQTEAALQMYHKGGDHDLTLALFHARAGNYEDALRHAEKLQGGIGAADSSALGGLGYVYGAAGERNKAVTLLKELKDRRAREHLSAVPFAWICLGLGEREEALQWLETAYQEKDPAMVWLKVLWFYDPIRSDPRFQDLLRRMNFPE